MVVRADRGINDEGELSARLCKQRGQEGVTDREVLACAPTTLPFQRDVVANIAHADTVVGQQTVQLGVGGVLDLAAQDSPSLLGRRTQERLEDVTLSLQIDGVANLSELFFSF